MSASYHANVYELTADSKVQCNETFCAHRAVVKLDRTHCTSSSDLAELDMTFLCALHLSAHVRNGASAFADRFLVTRHQPSPLPSTGENS